MTFKFILRSHPQNPGRHPPHRDGKIVMHFQLLPESFVFKWDFSLVLKVFRVSLVSRNSAVIPKAPIFGFIVPGLAELHTQSEYIEGEKGIYSDGNIRPGLF